MKLLHTALNFVLLASFIFVQACKPSAPKDVLKMKAIENVLYDYHMAQALAEQTHPDSVAYYTRFYQQAVFQKHNIAKTDFDHSMEYYERHTDQLKKIYEHLAERFGGSINTDAMPGNILVQSSVKGDTLSIWRGPSSVLLSSQGVNRFVYTQRADTSLQAGDQLQMTYNVDWFYHEGERRGIAQVVVRYEGDSIAVMQQYFYASGQQYMSLTLGNRKVKRIDCFVYQCAPWADRVRVLLLSNIKMYRLRSHDKEAKSEQVSKSKKAVLDSTKHRILNPQIRVRDSLIKSEKAEERKPHFL